MKSKVIRLNSIQIRYLIRIIESDQQYCIENIENTDDIYVSDFLQFELEISDSILNKLPTLPDAF